VLKFNDGFVVYSDGRIVVIFEQKETPIMGICWF
jgi:hypothetical protein